MKLLESYSRSASVDIKNRPTIYEKFYPLGEITKYITIQNSSGMPAKNYDYYQICLDLLLPILNKEGIKVIQLGEKEAPQLNGVMDLRGQTTLAQSYFILKRALLHLGNDSWITHAACAEEVPCVSLYGSTTVANHAPYHFNPDKSIFLESDRKGHKASFSRDEQPKMINFIWPELVVKSVCKLLNLEFNYSFKTISIGQLYNQKVLESAMTDVIDVKKLGTQNLIARMDWNFNLSALQQQLANNPCQIITDKELPESLLKQFQPRILNIIYKITEHHNPNFIKQLISNKISYQLVSELSMEKLNAIKLDYCDFGVIIPLNNEQPKELNNIDLEKLHFKSAKLILGHQKFFACYRDYVIGREYNPTNPEPLRIINKDLNLLYYDKEFLHFLEK